MSKELKASDKVTQKMTHDGAVLENLSTGEVTNISERPQEENLTQPIGGTAEKVIHRVETEYTRHTSKKSGKTGVCGGAEQNSCVPFAVYSGGTGDAGA